MINWVEFDRNYNLLTQSGQLSFTTTQIMDLIKNPYKSLKNHCIQIGRTISNQYHRVFAWQPHHQLALNKDQLTIKLADQVSVGSSQRFWETIPNLLLKQSQFDLISPEIVPYLGYYGYITYEISRLLEDYTYRKDTLPYPHLVLEFPTRILVLKSHSMLYIELQLIPIPNPSLTFQEPGIPLPDGLVSSTPYTQYIKDVQSIISHITRGDIYQANYTQQFILSQSNPANSSLEYIGLFESVTEQQSLPYSTYCNYTNFQIFSLSPELFLRISNGKVITKPIKGTRPRSNNPQEDQQFIEELLASNKDQAELAMIVDLLRNDLGKSSLPGSVEVNNHAVVESYENVHHLVSTVSARIDNDLFSSWKLLMRALPGGSISGVPKLRALEIIESHEQIPRGIYTGNIGYLGLNGDIEFNIAIRTAIINKDMIVLNAGGGIVFDSDPVEEYIESLHKAKHLFHYFRQSFVGHLLCYDGQFISSQQDVQLTNTGIFETILVNNGQIQNWQAHHQRIKQGIAYYDFSQSPSQDILITFIKVNLASSGLFRLNIYLWLDEKHQTHWLLTISSYEKPQGPFNLLLSPNSFYAPIETSHGLKSLNYNLYKKSTRSAQAFDCWDMLLYDTDGLILEGGRCTVYFYTTEGEWITPATNVVKGTLRQQLMDTSKVVPKNVSLTSLQNFQAIALSNALIGLVNVNQILSEEKIIWKSKNTTALQKLLPI